MSSVCRWSPLPSRLPRWLFLLRVLFRCLSLLRQGILLRVILNPWTLELHAPTSPICAAFSFLVPFCPPGLLLSPSAALMMNCSFVCPGCSSVYLLWLEWRHRPYTKLTKARSRHTSTDSPALLSQNFVGGLFHLNSFVCFWGCPVVLSSRWVSSIVLEGLEVAGWSHGLGCTAASNAEAIQSCSLLDSLGSGALRVSSSLHDTCSASQQSENKNQ